MVRTTKSREKPSVASDPTVNSSVDVDLMDISIISKPLLERDKYWCDCCNFSASTPSRFRNHLYSTRHYRNWTISKTTDDESTITPGITLSSSEELKSGKDDSNINNIIHLLDSDADLEVALSDNSVNESNDDYDSEQDMETYDYVSNVDEYEYEGESEYDEDEYEGESEYDEDEYEYEYDEEEVEEEATENNDEDIDLPLFGTGLFYPTNQSKMSPYDVSFQIVKNIDLNALDPMLTGSIFTFGMTIGMILERCLSQYVHGVCAC